MACIQLFLGVPMVAHVASRKLPIGLLTSTPVAQLRFPQSTYFVQQCEAWRQGPDLWWMLSSACWMIHRILLFPGHFRIWALEIYSISALLPFLHSPTLFPWNENENENNIKPGLWATGVKEIPETLQPGSGMGNLVGLLSLCCW